MDSSESKRLVYTVKECSELLGVNLCTAYVAIRKGDIPSILIGKRRLVPKAAFNKLLGIEA